MSIGKYFGSLLGAATSGDTFPYQEGLGPNTNPYQANTYGGQPPNTYPQQKQYTPPTAVGTYIQPAQQPGLTHHHLMLLFGLEASNEIMSLVKQLEATREKEEATKLMGDEFRLKPGYASLKKYIKEYK